MTLVAPQYTLLTVEQVAERLGTTVRFVRRLRAERRLAFVKLGKHLRVDSTDLEAFIDAHRERATDWAS
jgi:excisionase family DNA binding protein